MSDYLVWCLVASTRRPFPPFEAVLFLNSETPKVGNPQEPKRLNGPKNRSVDLYVSRLTVGCMVDISTEFQRYLRYLYSILFDGVENGRAPACGSFTQKIPNV